MIKLDNEYRIESDGLSFKLVRRYKPEKAPIKGKAREYAEDVIGYYYNIHSALNRWRRQVIMSWTEHDKMTLLQLVDRINEFDTKLMAKIKRLDG